jgi:hypothetical protein
MGGWWLSRLGERGVQISQIWRLQIVPALTWLTGLAAVWLFRRPTSSVFVTRTAPRHR